MSWNKIPTLEEIYNEFHKQKWFVLNGVYPKTIKNYEKVLADKAKVEYIIRFQNLLKRNNNMINWKIYIKANAEILKQRFDLKHLGTLGATKIYKNYLLYHNQSLNTEDDIYIDIINSLKFLNLYLKENNLTFEQYLIENSEICPIALQHLVSGNISICFYAIFNTSILNKFFSLYNDDIFYEFFNTDKYSFINNVLSIKHIEILKFKKVFDLSVKLEQKFLVNNNK